MHKKKTTKKSLFTALLLLALLLTAGGLAGVSAKYTAQKTETQPVESSAFYFTSDLLTEGGATYDLAENTTSVSFELRNWADELRWADTDIAYTVEVTGGATVSDSGSGTLTRSAGSKTSNTVTLSKLSAGTYTVTATATAPYTATLKATFTIPAAATGLYYSVTDTADSPYATLTVWTDNYAGGATLTWPAGLVPDATQDVFANSKTYSDGTYGGGSVPITVAAYSSYTFRFLKTDPSQTYTNDQIKAERG